MSMVGSEKAEKWHSRCLMIQSTYRVHVSQTTVQNGFVYPSSFVFFCNQKTKSATSSTWQITLNLLGTCSLPVLLPFFFTFQLFLSFTVHEIWPWDVLSQSEDTNTDVSIDCLRGDSLWGNWECTRQSEGLKSWAPARAFSRLKVKPLNTHIRPVKSQLSLTPTCLCTHTHLAHVRLWLWGLSSDWLWSLQA